MAQNCYMHHHNLLQDLPPSNSEPPLVSKSQATSPSAINYVSPAYITTDSIAAVFSASTHGSRSTFGLVLPPPPPPTTTITPPEDLGCEKLNLMKRDKYSSPIYNGKNDRLLVSGHHYFSLNILAINPLL